MISILMTLSTDQLVLMVTERCHKSNDSGQFKGDGNPEDYYVCMKDLNKP